MRRLVEKPALDDADIAQLVGLCKAGCGPGDDSLPAARGLDDAVTVNTSSGSSPTVRITAVDGVMNVNALREDQRLTVAPAGLTAVYGDNGAGKSGYVRILKQVCRARGARDVVHTNVYDGNSGERTATVSYEIETGQAVTAPDHDGGDGASVGAPVESVSITWMPNIVAPASLMQVSVFDSRSAAVYVTEENAVAYLPHGTDLFPRLVTVVEAVRGALEEEVRSLDAAADRFDSIQADTAVRTVLDNLHVANARQRVDDLIIDGDAGRARLEALRIEERRLRTDDPVARAGELRLSAKRLEDARKRLERVEVAFSEEAVAALGFAWDAREAARTAADLATTRAFSDVPVAGVGSETWQALWRAARKFAEQGAEPPRPFPVGPVQAPVCVLCQQPLAGDAASRMQGFEEFVQSETRTQLDRAITVLTERLGALRTLVPDAVADTVLLDEIRSLDPDLAAALEEQMRELAARRELGLTAGADGGSPPAWTDLVQAPSKARLQLEALVQRLNDDAARLDAAVAPHALKQVMDEARELEARLRLATLLDRAYGQIARQQRKAAVREAISSATTTGITRRNTEILREAVTTPLADAFAEHLKALRLTHLPVAVQASGGERGKAFHALALDAAGGAGVSTADVLSEGEHRGVALAAFLAEISLQESASTVVFDDPVSSMDHGRREYVARRIVEIAASRPVLLFTHDMVFLLMLQRAAEKQAVPTHARYFRRDGQQAGLILDEWPWDGQKVSARLGALRNMIQSFPKMAINDRPQYEAVVRTFYDLLRTTWERAVEDILFGGAIKRFGREVHTKPLMTLHHVTEAQMAALEAGMTRASEWISGHDHAADLALPTPEPAEVAGDLKALEVWVSEVKSALKR